MQDKRKFKSGLRGFARLYAVQILYRNQMGGGNLESLIKEAEKEVNVIISENYSVHEIDLKFFIKLISNTIQNLNEIDKIIEKHLSKHWSFSRLDRVMQSLIRLGACELKFMKDIPPTVIFNEYIEIAKAFFEKNDVAFLNGILNTISNESN